MGVTSVAVGVTLEVSHASVFICNVNFPCNICPAKTHFVSRDAYNGIFCGILCVWHLVHLTPVLTVCVNWVCLGVTWCVLSTVQIEHAQTECEAWAREKARFV